MYTIPHNPTNSHTILHNPTQSNTIPHNPIQSHIIPDHHRVGGSSEKETPQLGLGDLLRKELIGEFYQYWRLLVLYLVLYLSHSCPQQYFLLRQKVLEHGTAPRALEEADRVQERQHQHWKNQSLTKVCSGFFLTVLNLLNTNSSRISKTHPGGRSLQIE